MLELKILVGKLGTVDRLSPGAVAIGKVSALTHEGGNDAVKRRTLVVQRFAGLAGPFLAGTQRPKVFCGFGNHVGSEFKNDPSGGIISDCDIKKDPRVGMFAHLLLSSSGVWILAPASSVPRSL